jgi:hypothetical protein
MRGLRTSLLATGILCLPAFIQAQVESQPPVSNAMPTNNFGFNLPSKIGTLSYSLTGSEQIETGYGGGGVYANTTFSGSLAYLSKSEYNPFSLVYSGGVGFGNVPGTQTAQVYQNLAASQVYRTRSWVFVASDSFSYLPDSPTTGLSGIAGVGDVGVVPVQGGIGPNQTILTTNSARVSNGLEGSASWQVTPSLDMEGSGNWQVLTFTGSNTGYNTNTISASVGPNYRIDARTSVGASAYYTRQTYPNYQNYLIETEGVSGNFTRAWTRRFSTSFNLGPARTHGATTITIPSRWDLAGSANMSYATRTTGLFASYARSVDAGSGVIFGSISDAVTGGMNRPINRDWTLSADGGYSHNSGLTPVNGLYPTYESIYGAVQVSHRLTETLSMYGSYSAIWQTEHNQSSQFIAFNGLNHVVSIGITFAPAPLTSGR